jgi:hypothetical protein
MKMMKQVLFLGCMQAFAAAAASCIVDPGNEVYLVSEALSPQTAIAAGPSVSALKNTDAVETRHFLSAFSEVWDILAENYPVMIFVK